MKSCIPTIALILLASPAAAEVVASSSDHYTLRHEGVSSLSPKDMWKRLTHPETWWHPDHTFSGDSKNLSLKVKAGGLWREDWDEGSVAHGAVLSATKNKVIRLDAPFGPLQERAVQVVWTITITPEGEGSKVVFDEIANGTEASKLDELAPAVDFVKTEAMKRLTGGE